MKDRIVRSLGGNKLRAAAVIRRIAGAADGTPVGEEHFRQTRDKLSNNANLVLMVDVGAIVAVSMQVWNAYMDFAQAVVEGQGGQIEVIQDVDDEEMETDGDDEVVIGDDVVQGDKKPKVVVDDMLRRFDHDAINAMYDNPSYLGGSLAFEPQACRGKLVIPVATLQKIINAGGAIAKTLEVTVSDAESSPAEEMEQNNEEDENEDKVQ